MGTRATYKIYNYDKEPIIQLYTQYDGYPDGLVMDVLERLRDRVMVDGYNNEFTQINGPESFAVMFIHIMADLVYGEDYKTGILYLHPTKEKVGVSYEYDIFPPGVGHKVTEGWITVRDSSGETVFSGTIGEFLEWAKEEIF